MSKLSSTLCLALALLLSQTAVAVHDIHCLDELHAQTCQVCSAHDQGADSAFNQSTADAVSFGEKPEVGCSKVSLHNSNSFYLSRAPPQGL